MNPPAWKSSASFARRGVKRLAAALALAACLAGCASPRLGKAPASAPAKTARAQAALAKPVSATAQALSYPQTRPLDEKRPVKIKSDRLRYDDKRKETEFIGHVSAVQDTSTLFADSMRSSSQGESASAKGNLRLLDPARKVELSADEGDYSGSLSEANLRGGVILHSVDPYAVPVTVTGKAGWYQAVSRRARLEGDVRVMRGGLTATAEKAELEGGGEWVELDGDVSALLGANSVSADKAVLDGSKKSIVFEGGVKASLIPAQIRERSSHPEQP